MTNVLRSSSLSYIRHWDVFGIYAMQLNNFKIRLVVKALCYRSEGRRFDSR
jgi:hypothetical protein